MFQGATVAAWAEFPWDCRFFGAGSKVLVLQHGLGHKLVRVKREFSRAIGLAAGCFGRVSLSAGFG